jgi:hypothetical protein
MENEKKYVVTSTDTEDGFVEFTERMSDLKKACEQAKNFSNEDKTLQFFVMEVEPDPDDSEAEEYEKICLYDCGTKYIPVEDSEVNEQ